MKIGTWNKILVLALLVALGAGGYILYQNYEQQQVAQEEARIAYEAEQERIQKDRELTESFEGFLEDFVNDVLVKARDYKESRQVLKNLVKPVNLREPGFIAQNYELSQAALEDMQAQADDIMASFEAADAMFKESFQGFSEEAQASINDKWRQTRIEQKNLYSTYFTTDSDVFEAMEELLAFYNEHAQDVSFDENTETITMKTAELQEEHLDLTARYEALAKLQQEMFASIKLGKDEQKDEAANDVENVDSEPESVASPEAARDAETKAGDVDVPAAGLAPPADD